MKKGIPTWPILFALLAIACNTEKKAKVAFLLPHTSVERYVKEKAYFEQRISELGGAFYFASADYNQELQTKQVKEFLDDGIKAIVISPVNSNLAGEIVRMCHKYGATIISYDRMILNADVDYCITFRYQQVGEEMVNYCTKLMPKGNYIIVGGDKSDFNARQIYTGQIKAINSKINDNPIKILYKTFIEEWRAENAYQEMERFFRLSDIQPDAIICSSEKLALGAIQAIKKYNLDGKILVSGMDPDKDTYKRMIANEQTVSIFKPIRDLANISADFAYSCATNKQHQAISDSLFNGKINVPTIFLDPIVTDKSNIKDVLIREKFCTESDF